jgi:rSAM/selenodomain-associated transferase 2
VSCSFSIILPVLNESPIINQTIEHIYRLGYGVDLEVIVVDGDTEGGTVYSIIDERVIKVISPKGRGRQMNKGASVATGDILLFLHTDTELPENAFMTISTVIDRKQYVGGAFDLGIKSGRLIFRLIEKMVYIRTRITGIPYGDQAIFIKKDFFAGMNGYQEIPIMEDVELMRRIKKSGYKICIIPQRVSTSPRRWEKEGIIYCTLRNWALIILYLSGFKPEKLAKFYYREQDE